MRHANERRQDACRARAKALPARLDAARESRVALALLLLLGLATASVMVTTGALSQGHALRIAADLRP